MQKHPEVQTNKLTTTSLVAHLARVPDPRVNRNKDHDLVDILVIAVCALLCAAETFNDMEDFGKAKRDWFQTFLKLRGGIPSHDTFNRVFAALKPEHFLECFLGWTQSVRAAVAQEVVALDGKALRRALNGDQSVKYVVSAWAEGNGLVLGQLQVALKGNQETVHEEVKAFLDQTLVEKQTPRPPGVKLSAEVAGLAFLETVEKDHGRFEIRRYYQSDCLDWFADLGKWEGLKSVGMVESIREVAGKTTVERRYFLSSLPLGVETFARAVRGHWGVENKLHWVLDVCFREDQSRARTAHAAENLATLRRLALNLLKREQTKKRGIRGKQLNASWDHPYLLRLLGI
jgi:predicted transposase YbfD/YdcC